MRGACHDVPVDLDELGPFFSLQRTTDDARWLPLRALYDGPALDERVRYVGDVLGRMTGADVELRVAASTMSLGLFARLVAPLLGAAALGIPLPALGLDATFWQPVQGGPWPLALTGPLVTPDPPAALDEVVFPIADVVAERFSLSAQIARGNVASGVFGAVRMIRTARPDLAATARALGQSLLAGPLAGTGALDAEFVRSTCCLYYRIPGGGYCGDCVLEKR